MFRRISYSTQLIIALTCIMIISIFVGCSSDGASGVLSDGDTDLQDSGDNGGCAPGTNCEPCTSNIDCPPGMICDTDAGFCVPAGDPDGDDLITDGDDNQIDGDVEGDDSDGRIIEVIPDTLYFGNVQWGESSTETIIIKNSAAASELLEVQGVQFKTEGVIDFRMRIYNGASGLPVQLPVSLQPDESIQVDVTYSPSDARDDLNEQVLISSDDGDEPIVRVDLVPQYKGEANLDIQPNPILIEDTPVYASMAVNVRLSNDPEDEEANRVLKITNIALQSGQLVDDGYKLILPRVISEEEPLFLIPGAGLDIVLEFSPDRMSDFPNTLFITCNDPDDGPVVEASIQAKGIQADLVVTPLPIAFGPRRIGVTHYLSVEILNVGNDAFPVDDVALIDGNSVFAIDRTSEDLPWLILAGESRSLDIAFTPEQVDEEIDRLWIQGGETESGAMKPDYFVEVTGEGKQALIRVEPTLIDFGSIQHGQSASEQLRVFNDGTEDLLISRLEMNSIGSRDFGFVDVPEIYEPIAPEQSRFIEFTYQFDEGGNRSAVDIFSNAGNVAAGDSYTVEMQASSTDPIFFVEPTEIDFGSAEGEQTENVTVKNIGNGVLSLFNVGIDVGSNPDFSVGNFQKGGAAATLPLDLGQSETMTFDVIYLPTSPGQATGAVSVVHNDYDEFQPGDSDRTEFHIILNAAGPINHPPVAEIRANSHTENINVNIGTLLVLDDDGVYDDGVGSHDVDSGDTIVDWEFAIEGAPEDHNELAGEGNVRSVSANVAGEWVFSLRVKDSFDAWSVKDSITVKVEDAPVAILRANGETEAIEPVRAGSEILLDGIPSYDPDGGNLTEWEFRVDAAPAGADITLNGFGSSRSIRPRRVGTWGFSMRVRDDEQVWSGWDSVEVEVLVPQTINIVMDELNVCIQGISEYQLFFYNLDNLPCGPDACTWGPTHSGHCSNLGGNDGKGEIVWDYSEFNGVYPDLDGTYRISVKKMGFPETVEIRIYLDGSSTAWWQHQRQFQLGDLNTEWNIYLDRINGLWQRPNVCTPGGCPP